MTRKSSRPKAVARCGVCGGRLAAASLDALNAKLVEHYKVCPKS